MRAASPPAVHGAGDRRLGGRRPGTRAVGPGPRIRPFGLPTRRTLLEPPVSVATTTARDEAR